MRFPTSYLLDMQTLGLNQTLTKTLKIIKVNLLKETKYIINMETNEVKIKYDSYSLLDPEL